MNPTEESGAKSFRRPPPAPPPTVPQNASRPNPAPASGATSPQSWVVIGALITTLLFVAAGIVLAVQVPQWRAEAAAKRAAAEATVAKAVAQAKWAEVLKDMYKDVWEFRRSDEPDDYSQYRSSCRSAVLSRLKSPGSAKFVSMHVTTAKSGRPEVLGEVDAQNSYGGLLRSTYSCPFKPNGGVAWEEVLIFSTR
jgi:hypothetical protein